MAKKNSVKKEEKQVEDNQAPGQTSDETIVDEVDQQLESLQGDFEPSPEGANAEPENKTDDGHPYSQSLAVQIGGGLMMGFSILEAKRGDHWKIDESTAMEAGTAYAKFVKDKFPDVESSPTGGMIAATLMLLAMPIMGEVELAKQAKKNKSETDSKDEGGKDGDK